MKKVSSVYNMSYNCQHCQADLYNGDIFEVLKQINPETEEKKARLYGWTDTNRVYYKKVIIVQPTGPQFVICPYCRKKDPLQHDTVS